MKKILCLFIILIVAVCSCGMKEEGRIVNVNLTDTNGKTLLIRQYNTKYNDVGIVFDKYLKKGWDLEKTLKKLCPNLFEDLLEVQKVTFVQKVEAQVKFCAEKKPFKYVAHKNGRQLDLENTARAIFMACGAKTNAVFNYSLAENTIQSLSQKREKIGGFTTYFSTSSENRKHNIALAASFLNGLVIDPGAELSFNALVGARTEERGFKYANIIFNGEYVLGIGGGVCQVSTTIYNAWITSGLEVVNAVAHTLSSSYVPLSRDAAVSSNTDLVLKNNTTNPIYVTAFADLEHIAIGIYGESDGFEYNLISEKLKEVPAGVIVDIVYDKDAISETLEVITNGKVGYKSRAILEKVYKNKIIEKKVVRYDYYLPTPSKIIKRIPQRDLTS